MKSKIKTKQKENKKHIEKKPEEIKIDKEHRMGGTKLLWHMKRVIKHFDEGKRVVPLYIDAGITKFCNTNCIYCYGRYQGMTGEMIQRDVLLRFMEEAPRIGVKAIGLIGDGEPTCNPALYDAMDVGHENGLDLAISTNGLLLNSDSKLETILRNCTWMRFNLSAGNKESYKKIHGVNGFDKLVKIVKRIVELKHEKGYKCEVGLQSIFLPKLMMEDTIQEAQIALDTGVDYFLIKQCSLPDSGETGMYQFDLNLYDRPEVIDMLKRAEGMSTDKTKIIPKYGIMQQKGKRPYDGCLAVPFLWEVSGNGDCYSCGHMFQKPDREFLKFGNLHEQGIEEIVNSDRYWKIIDYMRNKFDVHTECKGACRLDKSNEFCFEYLEKPRGINFV